MSPGLRFVIGAIVAIALGSVLCLSGCAPAEIPEREGRLIELDLDAGLAVIDVMDADGETSRLQASFDARPGADIADLAAGWRVGFRASGEPSDLVLVSLRGLPGGEPEPAEVEPSEDELEEGHHHNPHHGGFVGMVEDYHFEVVADPDGLVRVYPSDFNRRPLTLRGFTGRATYHREGFPDVVRALGRISTRTGPALGGRFDPFEGEWAIVEFDIRHDETDLNIEFSLPVETAPEEAIEIPKRCVRSGRGKNLTARKPTCTIRFKRPVSDLWFDASGDTLAVAAVEHPVTVWSLDRGARTAQFGAKRGDLGILDKPQRFATPEVVSSSDGGYAVGYGKTVRVYPVGDETFQSVDAESALRIAAPAGGDLSWLAAFSGVSGVSRVAFEFTRIPPVVVSPLLDTAGPVRAIAVGGRDGAAAAADQTGAVFMFAPSGGAAVERRSMSGTIESPSALAFVGEAIAAASDSGAIAVWDIAGGDELRRRDGFPAFTAAAASPDGSRLALGAVDGAIRIFPIPALAPRLEIAHFGGAIVDMAWQGGRLVAADDRGEVAVWQMSAPEPTE